MLIYNQSVHGFSRFGSYFYRTAKNELAIESQDHLLLFKGYLYPDINLGVDDLFHHLVKNKVSSLKSFKGRYCGALIDRQSGSLIIFNDQLGLNDIYYYKSNKEIAVSDSFIDFFSIKDFSRSDLDNVGIAEFMLFEHPLLDRTFIKDIKLLPYATVMDVKGKESKSYWQYRFEESPRFETRRAMAELNLLFQNALHRAKCLSGDSPIAIGLSGGLDSALCAKYAVSQGIKLTPFVFDHNRSDAVHVSEKMARALGLEVRAVRIEDCCTELMQDHMKFAIMVPVMYSAYCTTIRNLPKTRTILTGYLGGELFGNHMRPNFEQAVVNYMKNSDIVSPEMHRLINQDLDYYRALKLPDNEKTQIFDFECRQLRHTKESPFFTFYGTYETFFSPFSDIDVVEHALSITSHEHVGCKFYHQFYKEYLPEVAAIRPERRAYKLTDSPLQRKIKTSLLRAKMKVLQRTGINLPLYKTIRYLGALDWDAIYKHTELSESAPCMDICGIGDITGLDNSLVNIRVKFHSLTVQRFFKDYIR